MNSLDVTLSSMGSKGTRKRGAASPKATVTTPQEVFIIEAAPDRPSVVNAGPTVGDPTTVKRVLTVNATGEGASRVLAYRRVSTMEQMRSGTSLDAQEEEIRRYCQYARLPDPIDFEEAESGGAESQEKREKITALLKAVRPGDLVIVAKLDRFSRDIVFTISAVRDIIKRGARFLSLAERFDASTPEGETQMAMWASIAQMERARIRDRTEGNRKRLRALGMFVEGNPPFGYRRAKGKDIHDKPRRLEQDPVNAPIVREMFEMSLNGKSVESIALHCQTHYPGIATFGVKSIIKNLKNRVYAGQVALTPVRPSHHRQLTQLPAEWVDAHEPIVSLAMWSAAQHALAGRRSYGRKAKPDSRSALWLIRGLARCSVCGSIIASRHASERNKHAGYYACRKRAAPILKDGKKVRCEGATWNRQDATDQEIERLTLRHFKTIDAQLMRPPPPPVNAPNFEARRAKLYAGRSRLVTMVTEGQWSMEVIKAKAAEIERELAAIDAEERARSAEASADTVENRRGALAWIKTVAANWQALPVPVRRAALAVMVAEIKIGPAGIAVQWCDAATMATRYAEGKLSDLTTIADEPRRPSRPALAKGAEQARALSDGDAA